MLVTCKTFWRCLVGVVLLLNLHFWLLIPTALHRGESIASGKEPPAKPRSLIDSGAVGSVTDVTDGTDGTDVAQDSPISAVTRAVTASSSSTWVEPTEGNSTAVAAPAAPAPKLPPLQRRCADPRDKLNKTCHFPRRRCKLSHLEILGSEGSKCPQDAWVNAMVRADPDPDKVIMNVGCNKGHDSIAWLQRFDQRRFWNLRKWTSLMAAHKAVCALDTQIRKPPPFNSSKAPVALCVEAMPATVHLLKEVRKLAGYSVKSSTEAAAGWLKFWWRAMTDVAKPGDSTEFINASAGQESARMGLKASYRPKAQRISVPLGTVDTIMHNLGLPKVDILIVDTEGADPAVLRGAEDALGSVRYLMFETHRDLKGTAWSKETIHSVVSNLNSRGFDCYWAGGNGNLASITWCYHASFEKVGWGNIACVKRGDVWWQVMESFDPNARFSAKSSRAKPEAAPSEVPSEAPSEAPSEEPMPKVAPEETHIAEPFNATLMSEAISAVVAEGAFVQLPGVQKRCADPRNRRIKGCKYPRERCRLSYWHVIGFSGTSCPGTSWLDDLVQADPDPHKVIMNIGCSSGQDSIGWLQRFDQHHFWNRRKWSDVLPEPKAPCSLEAHIRKPPRYNSSATPMAVCIDAMPLTVHLLKETRHRAKYDPKDTESFGKLKILQRAITDAAAGATMDFLNNAQAKIRVPAATVDAVVQTLHLPKVDVLIVSTDGSDPAVLRGAENTLRSVRYLMFETHRDLQSTNWSTLTVFSVVNELNNFGFDCYWAGNNGNLSSITSCYQSFFEKLGWGNVACVKRDDVWWQVLEKHDPNTLAFVTA